MLLIAFTKTREEYFAQVSFSVAISIFRVKYIWRCAYDHSLAPGDDACRKIQPFSKHRRFIKYPIVVCVLKESDGAARFPFAIDSQRIIAHFHDPELSISAPFKADWALNKWFLGHQLSLEAGFYMESFE